MPRGTCSAPSASATGTGSAPPPASRTPRGGLYLASEDLARLWYLFLRDGNWNGRRVLSSDWVRQSVTPAIAVANRPGAARYGYKWWLWPNPTDTTKVMWGGSGFGGQFPVAIPEEDLVVVINQWNILPGRPGLPLGRVLNRILSSMPDRRRQGGE